MGIRDPAELSQVLDDIRQDAAGTIAWVRIVDMAGHPLAQSGNSSGLPFGEAETATGAGRVRLGFRDPPNGEPAKCRSPSLPCDLPGGLLCRPARQIPNRSVLRPVPRFVEIALYLDSAFRNLRAFAE